MRHRNEKPSRAAPAHTRSPYHVELYYDSNGWTSYQIEGIDETEEEAEANRQLFEAAPKMLEHLENIVLCAYDDDSSVEDICADFDRMRELAALAIAQAKGPTA